MLLNSSEPLGGNVTEIVSSCDLCVYHTLVYNVKCDFRVSPK